MEPETTTIKDIISAQEHVYRYLKPTHLFHYATLSKVIGTATWIKHENHQPVGAFKVRGGLTLAATLTQDEKNNGLFTASTGNHGQSIAFAARAHGIRAVIAVPDEKWVERPLAVVVQTSDADDLSGTELRQYLAPQFAKFWLPDKIVFIDEIPKTSVGKFDKKVLRHRYAEGQLG